MQDKPITVLLIEDDPDDVFLLRMVLQKSTGPRFELVVAPTLVDGLDILTSGDIDIVLLDLSLPDSVGLETFTTAHEKAPGVPIIVLSGLDDETFAVKAVHAGAQDYLVKGQVNSQLLTRAMVYAIERTQAREALLKAEEKYRSIFENAVEGIFQTTPDGHFISVNPALVRLYGYDSAEELTEKTTDIEHQLYVDPARRAEFVRLMQENGMVTDFESEVYRKDGSIIWISENARAVRNGQGKVLYYEGMVEDITKRKAAEERLRFSELRFRSVWENSKDGMRLTDEQGIVLAVNPSFSRIVGLPAAELVGKPFTYIYTGREDLDEVEEKYRHRFAERQIETQLERRVTFRSGRQAVIELSNSFIAVGNNQPLLLSVFHDITVRKEAEERERATTIELARNRAELQRKNEVMEEDLHMAHEIQQAILPQQYPTIPSGVPQKESLLQFCHRYHPSGLVGGDFFNVLPLSESKAGVFICDVMGHGVRSALVTTMVRALVEELRPIAEDPGQMLTRINQDLRAILQQTGTPLFTTAFYIVFDLDNREFLYSNAGHPKPFLGRRQSGQIQLLQNSAGTPSPALALFPESIYSTCRRELLPGDLVVLFTDGLYEVEGAGEVQYTQEMLIDAVQKHLNLPCPELFETILSEILGFSINRRFLDDVCMVGVEVATELPRLQHAAAAAKSPSI